MIEDVTIFGESSLVGVLCCPAVGSMGDRPGVILLNPGLLHRVGANRLYVKLARVLAAQGFDVLRFDFSGKGDSPQRTDHIPLERSAVAETRAAIDHLIATTGCSRVLLIGHCSGAFLSLMTAFVDERVSGVIAISPEGGDESWVEFDRRQKEARYYANYYSRGALSDSGRWRRLLTGRASYRSIVRNVLHNVVWYRVLSLAYRFRNATGTAAGAASERSDVQAFKDGLRILAGRKVPILLIHPDQSAGPEMLRALLGDTLDEMRAAGDLEVAYINEADHMFTPLAAQRDLVETICRWALASAPPSPIATRAGASR